MTHLLHILLLKTPFNFYNLLHYNYSLLKVVEPQLLQQLLIEFLRVQLPVKFKDVHTDHVNILFCRHLFSLLHFFHFPTFPMDLFVFYFLLLFVFLVLNQVVKAENIHFNDSVYDLKYSDITSKSRIVENEYYKVKENRDYWTSMIGIYYNPEISNPLKYASEVDKKIETTENLVLLKFMSK